MGGVRKRGPIDVFTVLPQVSLNRMQSAHLGSAVENGLQVPHPLCRSGDTERPLNLGPVFFQVKTALGDDYGDYTAISA